MYCLLASLLQYQHRIATRSFISFQYVDRWSSEASRICKKEMFHLVSTSLT
jgi:hypothetical protein